jgi:hypothetical protein
LPKINFNDRSQESGVRSQESGVRSQESGVRSQESGGIKRRRKEEKRRKERREESNRVIWLFEGNFVADSSSYRYK